MALRYSDALHPTITLKAADYFLPSFFRAAKTVKRLEARVEELKGSLSSVKEERDRFKERAHTAEESLRQSQRKFESDPIRCAHFLDQAVSSLPPELEVFREDFRQVSPLIDIEDDMIWSTAPDLYFKAGIDAMRIVAKVCEDYLDRSPESILDLPCGHGRVMRWLRRAYPDAKLAGCDTQEHGVAFCESQFGSAPIKATAKPSELVTDSIFDVFWIGSLFTHLPESEFVAFLNHLPNLLNVGGIVIFTTHGEEAMTRLRNGDNFHLHHFDKEAIEANYKKSGFDFVPYKKYPDYGVSFSSREFVEQHIGKCPNLEALSLAEDIWSNLQDVHICRRTG